MVLSNLAVSWAENCALDLHASFVAMNVPCYSGNMTEVFEMVLLMTLRMRFLLFLDSLLSSPGSIFYTESD